MWLTADTGDGKTKSGVGILSHYSLLVLSHKKVYYFSSSGEENKSGAASKTFAIVQS